MIKQNSKTKTYLTKKTTYRAMLTEKKYCS